MIRRVVDLFEPSDARNPFWPLKWWVFLMVILYICMAVSNKMNRPSTLPRMDDATRNPSINPCTDPNVESVIVRHRERARYGLAKYNTTTAREDLSLEQWLQHLQDELMDAAVYVERLKVEVAKLPEVAAKLVKP